MSYIAKVEPMPGNPATQKEGDRSGFWRVVIENRGTVSDTHKNPPRQIMNSYLSYEEAIEICSELNEQFSAQ